MNKKFGEGLKNFTVTCMENRWSDSGASSVMFHEHWDEASDLEDFRRRVFEDNSLALTQGYAELSKASDGHWYRVRAMLGDRVFKTVSDIGGVKISSPDGKFSTVVPNGAGDGDTRCAVIGKGEPFNDNMMRYTGTSLHGEFRILESDCGNQPIRTLNGDYFVYACEGMVAFVEMCGE